MSKEKLDVFKSILVVLILTLTTILICVKIIYKKYIYTLRYYESENLYIVNISDDYKVKVDIKVICEEDKCKGDYKSPISVNVDINKTLVEEFIAAFNLPKNGILDITENTITSEQKSILYRIIG